MTGSPWEKILAGILAEFFSQPTAAPQAKRPFWKAGAFYAALAAAVAAVGAAVSAGGRFTRYEKPVTLPRRIRCVRLSNYI